MKKEVSKAGLSDKGKPASVKGKSKSGKNSFIGKMMIFFSFIATLFLLLSYLASYISPAGNWYFAFLGLGFPIILLVNLFFVVYLALTKKKFVVIPIFVILIGFNHIGRIFQVTIRDKKYTVNIDSVDADKDNIIKVMSYNVRLFDLYNWTKNLESRGKIFSMLKEEKGDVICFQEFFTEDEGDFQNLDTLKKIQDCKACHVEYTNTLRKTDHWGIATYSRYPIINKGQVELIGSKNNICIFSDIKINKDTIRVYNAHLESVHFNREEYKYIDDIKNDAPKKDDSGPKKIFRRLRTAFIKRAGQAEKLAEHINGSPYRVILCGDLNDTPASYTYHTIAGKLQDSFVESGNGIGSTYYGIFPSFRIDYILYDKRLKSRDFRIIKKKLSDHYPITTNIEI